MEAKSELEKHYCEILIEGYGKKLPNFYNFKRNTPNTQYLLLKPWAKRAGIKLTKPSAQTKSAVMPQAVIEATGRKTTSTNKKQQKSDITEAAANTPTNKTPFNENSSAAGQTTEQAKSVHSCKLRGEEIVCAHDRFFLTTNTPLDRLPKGSLSLRNRLIFPTRFQSQSNLQYLSEIYPYYIEKMLLIGLGDSTMSFTKFNALYEDALNKGENFSKRFDDMYELLKVERQSMGIKARYRNNFPENIEQCMQLNAGLIACDNVEQNWVYRKLAQ
ncbi:MAG: hypothetical protein K6L76_13860 [Agarilytica sp.]